MILFWVYLTTLLVAEVHWMGRLVKPHFKIVSQHVPGGTQDNRCLTRDLNTEYAEYETGALDRDVCCQSLLLRVRVETSALSNSVVRPHCMQLPTHLCSARPCFLPPSLVFSPEDPNCGRLPRSSTFYSDVPFVTSVLGSATRTVRAYSAASSS